MKKRMIALVLVLTLCVAMSMPVFAGTGYDQGLTSGGTYDLYGCASLRVDKNMGTATSSAKTIAGKAYDSSDMTYRTTINYYYTNSNGQSQATSGSGAGIATAGKGNGMGQYATSQHRVSGGTTWGSWSGSLRANA